MLIMSYEAFCGKCVVSNVKGDRNRHNTGVINEVAKLKPQLAVQRDMIMNESHKIRKRSYQSITKLNPKNPSV